MCRGVKVERVASRRGSWRGAALVSVVSDPCSVIRLCCGFDGSCKDLEESKEK